MDALSDVLSTIRFKSTVYCQADFTAPWGLKMVAHPGHTGFLMVLRGGCLLEIDGQENNPVLTLGAGDLVISPMGIAYSIKDALNSPLVNMEDLFESKPTPGSKVRYGGNGTLTNLVMGCFEFDCNVNNPLLRSLPSILHVRAEELHSEPWLEATFRFLATETANQKQGSSLVVSRLADLLFVQAVRAHMSQVRQCPKTTSWLKALSDPQIGRALSLIHENPQSPWTVASLASEVSMSRSSFAAKFAQLVNVTPVEYVTSWRMQKAEELLRQSTVSPAEIASSIGYQSEAAFRKAFKRETGRTPGVFRKVVSA